MSKLDDMDYDMYFEDADGPPSKHAEVLFEKPKWLVVSADYCAEFVAALKRFPSRDRRWDPDAQVWRVHRSLFKSLVALLNDYYDTVACTETIEELPPYEAETEWPPVSRLEQYGAIIADVTDVALERIIAIAEEDRQRWDEDVAVIDRAVKEVREHRARSGKAGV